VLHAKLRNRTCQGLDQQRQEQGQGLTLRNTVKIIKVIAWMQWTQTYAAGNE